jgi:large conductance mechanosensitive channel
MSLLKEFREFAVKGNVIDLAVGVIIGAAFGKIVTSLVEDIVMPLLAMLVGNLDFSNLFIVLGAVPAGTPLSLPELKKAGVPLLAYGSFITVALNFLIVSAAIFVMVRQVNRLKRLAEQAPAEPAAPPLGVTPPEPVAPAPEAIEQVRLLREIRDSLQRH